LNNFLGVFDLTGVFGLLGVIVLVAGAAVFTSRASSGALDYN